MEPTESASIEITAKNDENLTESERLKFQGGYLEGVLDTVTDLDLKRSQLIQDGMSFSEVIEMSDDEIQKRFPKKIKKTLDW